ncbi:MAG: hypothetical protein J6D02_07965 [Lachnospira sp.]|nr:hypothetical protein [Lachnospira sp.]
MELVKQAADMVTEWAGNAKEAMSEYMETEKTVTRRETLLTGALILCIGVIIGFMMAPIKKGISIASDNVNSFNDDDDEE